MITGLHAILYAHDAEKVRAFLRDVLGLKSVDAGHGWRIFAVPPAEIAAHPTEAAEEPHHQLYLMCDDLKATMKELQTKGVECGAIIEARWGSITSIQLHQFNSPGVMNWACTSRSIRLQLELNRSNLGRLCHNLCRNGRLYKLVWRTQWSSRQSFA